MDRTETRFHKRGQITGKITTSHQPHPQNEQSPQRSTSGYPLQEVVDDEVLGPSAPGVDPSPPCRSLGWKRKREWSDESAEEPEKELAPEPEETWVVEMPCGLTMKLKQQRVSPILPEHHKDFNSQLDTPPVGELSTQEDSECDQLQKHYTVAWFLYSAPGVDPSPPHRSFCWKRKTEWWDESEESEEELRKVLAPEPEEIWVAEMLCGLKMKLKRRRVSLVLPEHHEAFNRLLEDPVIKRFLAWDKDLRVSDKYLLAMVIAYFSRAGFPSWLYQRIHFFLAL
nr:speedy protein E2-like [Pan paniscus]